MSEKFFVFILTFGFLAYIFICFVHGWLGKSNFKPISDNFNIGYIERKDPIVIEKPVVVYKDRPIKDKKQQIKIKALKKQLQIVNSKLNSYKQKQKKLQAVEPNQLHQDCLDALVALGCKKSEAKQGVESFFKNNNVDSIEEFIVKYFKKG